ncbi:transmembrane protein 60-like [Nerophis lumbriciformis]|uniref:transmembrane protein 60-like n=1 Tax=Nerophis lumbriciformis TaxID=546530 RepID=UPI002ADF1355|nr:transmembrane protein 60-like [Nerophis lumbriciformis]XP_061780269.1 transmembrane protein 60-like [Nerophis lumbriciformis]
MKMSLVQRVFLSWVFSLLFLIMLVLKLDSKIHWNWFLIFLPVWTLDAVLLLMVLVQLVGRCKPDLEPREGEQSLAKKLWYLAALLLKLAFCVSLCSRLERLTDAWLSVVCVPLWVLLAGALLELGHNVFHHRRD